MIDANENGSKRVLILVHPTPSAGGYSRPAKSFLSDQSALDYALEGDALLYVLEDGTTYPTTMGPKSGVDWGSCVAKAYLYSDWVPEKSDILDMCFHEDKEATIGFVNALVDYVIECRAEKVAGL